MQEPAPAPSKLTLYQMKYCAACVDVEVELRRLRLSAERVSLHEHPEARAELQRELGSSTVPVLRVEESDGGVRWLPESLEIIRYLRTLAPERRGVPLWVLRLQRAVPWVLLVVALFWRQGPTNWLLGAAVALLVARRVAGLRLSRFSSGSRRSVHPS